MPRLAHVPRALTRVPFRGTDAVARGLLTRRQLQSSVWRRLFPDTYVAADRLVTYPVRCHAAGLWVGGRGAVSGLSAAALWEADVVRGDDTVEVTVGPGHRPRSPGGMTLIRSGLPAGDVSDHFAYPVTTAARTAFDLARRLPFTEAVIVLDALAGAMFVEVGEVAQLVAERPRWPGVAKVPDVLAAADAFHRADLVVAQVRRALG